MEPTNTEQTVQVVENIIPEGSSGKISRRNFLKLFGLGGVGLALAACGPAATEIIEAVSTPEGRVVPHPENFYFDRIDADTPTFQAFQNVYQASLSCDSTLSKENIDSAMRQVAQKNYESVPAGGWVVVIGEKGRMDIYEGVHTFLKAFEHEPHKYVNAAMLLSAKPLEQKYAPDDPNVNDKPRLVDFVKLSMAAGMNPTVYWQDERQENGYNSSDKQEQIVLGAGGIGNIIFNAESADQNR